MKFGCLKIRFVAFLFFVFWFQFRFWFSFVLFVLFLREIEGGGRGGAEGIPDRLHTHADLNCETIT